MAKHNRRLSDSRRKFLKKAGMVTSVGSVFLAGCAGGEGDGTGTPESTATPTETEVRTTVSQEAAREGGDVVYAPGDDTQELHPHYRISRASAQLLVNVVEPLFRLSNDLRPEPHLVEDYSVSDDNTTYTLQVREGVRFHPPVDREMTADDVAASLRQIKDDDAAAASSDFQVAESIEATGDYEVQINLESPFSALLTTVLVRDTTSVIPEEMLENEEGYEPVGTGPFVFDERDRDNFTRVTKFEDYWQEDLPYFDSVTAKPISEGSVRLQELQTGDAHIASTVPSKDAGTIEDDEDLSLEPLKGFAVEYVSFNCQQAPFDDKRVRQAVKYATDYEELINFALDGRGQPAATTLPPQSPFAIDEEPAQQDYEKAQQLLDDAGYGDGFETTFKLPEAYPRSVDMGTPMQQWLQEIGIDAQLQRVTWDTWISEVFGNVDYEMTTVPFYGVYDAYGGLNKIFHSNGTFNYFNYESDEMDGLLEEAARTVDEDQRRDLYVEAQELFREDTPMFTPFYRDQLFARRKTIENRLVWGEGELRLWNNWFADE